MTKPRILITGVTGFVAGHLLDRLRAQGYDNLWGLSRHTPLIPLPGVTYQQADLCDAESFASFLGRAKPDWIFHLAGQAVVAESWSSPVDTFTQNVNGQITLFECLRSLKLNAKVLVVGSSEEYGLVKEDELPVLESNPLRPLSPYAVSKVTQDLLAYQYFKSYGLRTVRVRAFNHTGPGRPKTYAMSNFAYQISQIEAGKADPELRAGNLDVQRDYLDVRDVVDAYILALEKGEDGEVYNICSGQPQNLRALLQILLESSKFKITVMLDPSRFRPSDLPVMYGSGEKFRQRTGWTSKIAIHETLRDLLDYWRRQNANAPSVANVKL